MSSDVIPSQDFGSTKPRGYFVPARPSLRAGRGLLS
jgi:hypothetical protein